MKNERTREAINVLIDAALKLLEQDGEERPLVALSELLEKRQRRTFDQALGVWYQRAQAQIEESFENTDLEPNVLALENRRSHIRVICSYGDGEGRYAFCFINKKSGDVLRAVNWRKPSRSPARGNIFTNDLGVNTIGAI